MLRPIRWCDASLTWSMGQTYCAAPIMGVRLSNFVVERAIAPQLSRAGTYLDALEGRSARRNNCISVAPPLPRRRRGWCLASVRSPALTNAHRAPVIPAIIQPAISAHPTKGSVMRATLFAEINRKLVLSVGHQRDGASGGLKFSRHGL